MSGWEPIETAPEGEWILLYTEWADPTKVWIGKFRLVLEIENELVSQSVGASGRRRSIYEEIEKRIRVYDGEHTYATHWMPLPEGPA